MVRTLGLDSRGGAAQKWSRFNGISGLCRQVRRVIAIADAAHQAVSGARMQKAQIINEFSESFGRFR